MDRNKKGPLAILFFIGRARPSAKEQAEATRLAAETGKRVHFRNAVAAHRSDEKPEDCLGCAGRAPTTYRNKFPFYGPDGVQPEAAPANDETPKVNALGLPEGHPEDRDGLAEVLREAGVEFHPRTGEEKLVALYRETFLAE